MHSTLRARISGFTPSLLLRHTVHQHHLRLGQCGVWPPSNCRAKLASLCCECGWDGMDLVVSSQPGFLELM